MSCIARTDVSSGVVRLLAFLAIALCASGKADVIATQLANEGVLLDDGVATRVMIDGMVVEPYSLYGGLPLRLHEAFERAEGPFQGIDLALASHQHHDHNQPVYACSFLQHSEETLFVSSAQVMDLMREKCRQFTLTSPRLRVIDPRYDRPESLRVGAARVTVFPLSHGVGKYARLQNYAHLVELGGLRVLHIGDAAMDATDFARAGVDRMQLDVALIPFWYFQPGPGGSIVRQFLDAPHKIAVHVPPAEMNEVRSLLRTEYPDVQLLEHAFDSVRFPAPPPPSH